jgi:hypothetical protein
MWLSKENGVFGKICGKSPGLAKLKHQEQEITGYA